MSAKKPQAAALAVKKQPKPKVPAKAKAPASSSKTITLKKQKNPKFLDRLFIPGRTQGIEGYHAGIPKWLIQFGLNVTVYRVWPAKPGDIITVGILISPTELRPLKAMQLKDGEESKTAYYFTFPHDDLPDGIYDFVYTVHYSGTSDYDLSYALKTVIKTDEPGGEDSGFPADGHPNLKFELSDTEVSPPVATRGVTVKVKPYPNMHILDNIHLRWGGLEIIKPIRGVGQETEFKVTHADIVEAGDSFNLSVDFLLVDFVGNTSKRPSAPKQVLVDLDESKVEAPAFMTDDPDGYIDLERLDGNDLKVELYTSRTIGLAGDLYDVTFRSYPKLGGVVVHRTFKTIETAGIPHYVTVPYGVVRSAIGGKAEASFVLRKTAAPYEVFSKKRFAQVMGGIIYIEAPYFEGYTDQVNPIPSSLVFVCPWFEWRKPTDELTIVIRHEKQNNETLIYSHTASVGTSWPHGSPVKRLVYKQDLEQFRGLKVEIYFVYRPALLKASSQDINESLRHIIQFGQ